MRLPHSVPPGPAGASPFRDAAMPPEVPPAVTEALAAFRDSIDTPTDVATARRLVELLLDDTSSELALNGPAEIVKKVGGHRYAEANLGFTTVAAYHAFINDVLLANTGTAERVDGTHMILEGQMRIATGDPRAPYSVSRLHVLAPPLPGLTSAKVTIAKKSREPLTLDDMIERGSLTADVADFLQAAASGRAVVVVSGVTGAGKCLAGDTPVELGDGTVAPLGEIIDRHLDAGATPPPDVVAFRADDCTTQVRPAQAWHRRPAPDQLHRLTFDTGATLTLTGDHPIFVLADPTPRVSPAAALRVGDVVLAPRRPRRSLPDPARAAVASTLGRPPTMRELAVDTVDMPGVRLPLSVTAELGWLAGAVVSAGVETTAHASVIVRAGADVVAGLATVHAGVFGVAARLRRDSIEIDHPVILGYLTALGVVGAECLPSWVEGNMQSAHVLAGVIDATATIRASDRRIRIPAPTPARRRALQRLLAQHGIRSTYHGVDVTCHGSAAVALLKDLPLRVPNPGAEALLRRGPGRDDPLIALPALLNELLDELVAAGAAPNRTAAAAVVRDAAGMRERTFFHALAGERALTWNELTQLSKIQVQHAGRLLARLRRLHLNDVDPAVVIDSQPVDNRDGAIRHVYDISVADPACRAFVADGIAVHNSTLLEALSHHWDLDDRVIVIEDTPELNVAANDVVYLESYTPRPGEDPSRAVPMELLVRQTMRMRMDRVVVGECRGGEVLDWLIAANSGAQGSATTVHADTPRRAIDKLMRLASRSRDAAGVSEPTLAKEIAATVDLIVQLGLVDGRHLVLAVEEVSRTVAANATVQTATLFSYDHTTGRHDPVNRPSDEFLAKLAARGTKIDLAPWQRSRAR